MASDTEPPAHVLCVSWDSSLAQTRELLLTEAGYTVTSALGPNSHELWSTKADLLLLGHSVPQEEKKRILECFRRFNDSPALSLLAPGQTRLLNVEYAVEFMNPQQLMETVQRILPPTR